MLIEDRGWTKPEQHMIAYHTSHLIGLATGAIAVLVLSLGALAVSDALGVPEHPLSKTTWGALFVAIPLLTAGAWGLKLLLLRQADTESGVYDLTIAYKRAMIAAHLGFAVAGLLPIAAGFASGLFTYHLLIVLVPISAAIMNFPHERKVALFFDEVLGTRPVDEEDRRVER